MPAGDAVGDGGGSNTTNPYPSKLPLEGYEVSVLFLMFVGITLTWEFLLGVLTFVNNLVRGKRAAWLDRVKEEVLALGVVSLVLLFLQPELERICKQSSATESDPPVDYSDIPGAYYVCPPGTRNVFPAAIIHAAHYLLFYLAVVHIVFNMATNSITARKFSHMVLMERDARNIDVQWELDQVQARIDGRPIDHLEDPVLADPDATDNECESDGRPNSGSQYNSFRENSQRDTPQSGRSSQRKVPFGKWRSIRWMKKKSELLAGSVNQTHFNLLRKICMQRFEAHAMDANVRSFSFINIASQVLEADLEQVYAHAWLMILFMTLLLLYPKQIYQIVWANVMCMVCCLVLSIKLNRIMRSMVQVCRNVLIKGVEQQKHLRREEKLFMAAGSDAESQEESEVAQSLQVPPSPVLKKDSNFVPFRTWSGRFQATSASGAVPIEVADATDDETEPPWGEGRFSSNMAQLTTANLQKHEMDTELMQWSPAQASASLGTRSGSPSQAMNGGAGHQGGAWSVASGSVSVSNTAASQGAPAGGSSLLGRSGSRTRQGGGGPMSMQQMAIMNSHTQRLAQVTTAGVQQQQQQGNWEVFGSSNNSNVSSPRQPPASFGTPGGANTWSSQPPSDSTISYGATGLSVFAAPQQAQAVRSPGRQQPGMHNLVLYPPPQAPEPPMPPPMPYTELTNMQGNGMQGGIMQGGMSAQGGGMQGMYMNHQMNNDWQTQGGVVSGSNLPVQGQDKASFTNLATVTHMSGMRASGSGPSMWQNTVYDSDPGPQHYNTGSHARPQHPPAPHAPTPGVHQGAFQTQHQAGGGRNDDSLDRAFADLDRMLKGGAPAGVNQLGLGHGTGKPPSGGHSSQQPVHVLGGAMMYGDADALVSKREQQGGEGSWDQVPGFEEHNSDGVPVRRFAAVRQGQDVDGAGADKSMTKVLSIRERQQRAEEVVDAKHARERDSKKVKHLKGKKAKKMKAKLEIKEMHLPYHTLAELAAEVEAKVKGLFWFGHPHLLLWFVNIVFLITSLSITTAVAFVIPYNKFQKLSSLGHDLQIWLPIMLLDVFMAVYLCWYVLPMYALITTSGTSFPPRVIEEVRAAKTLGHEEYHGISGMVLGVLNRVFVGVDHDERQQAMDLATYFVTGLADHAGIVLNPHLRNAAEIAAGTIMLQPGVKDVLKEFAQFWHDLSWYGPPEQAYAIRSDLSFMQAAFAQLDADGSGALSFSELATMVRALGALATAGDIETMLWEVDLDGSRSVGFDEFTKFLAYAFFDADANGFIGVDEIEDSMKKLGYRKASPEACALLMAAADHNGDGRIGMREFFMLFEKLLVEEEDDDDGDGSSKSGKSDGSKTKKGKKD